MNGKLKSIVFLSILSLIFSISCPGISALADDADNSQVTLWDIEDENKVQYDKKENLATVEVTKNKLFINGVPYNQAKLINLLKTASETNPASDISRQDRFAAAAGVYLIPGVGEVALAATGAIILGGVTIGAGHWAYKTIKNYFTNKASGPVGKPNLKKQGRELNNKARNNKNFKSRSNKNPNRPMKKHTPSKKHKGGK
ncbi:hypothetical protein [Enterococcus entomosocium]|uniref:hypothetical protein n=1 Tax=Enterococcus entomosocium TaxID=3034352 RepID=UPI0026493DA9|nr:hypothetical protein [Enterococcus entomosocium]